MGVVVGVGTGAESSYTIGRWVVVSTGAEGIETGIETGKDGTTVGGKTGGAAVVEATIDR